MKNRRRKLDNVALAFPAATDQEDTRVFQISCVITDLVDEKILKQAVEAAVSHYPLFHCVLKRGNFWFYFEKTDLPTVIRKQDGIHCRGLYDKRKQALLYQVTYGKHKINLEIFHALTDGTGAIAFLSSIVKEYLKRIHDLPQDTFIYPGGERQEEDSFSKYYSSQKQERLIKKSTRAFQISGEKVGPGAMLVHEYTLSSQALLQRARGYQVSVTVYLTAAFLCAIASVRKDRGERLPVVLMIPVNLRKFYPSETMVNFFGWMEIEYLFQENHTFAEVLQHVKKRFEQDLQKEQVAARMNKLVKLEKNPLLHFVPLRIKDLVLKWGTKRGSKNVTGVFSNMGVVEIPEDYRPYIRRFGAMASTDRIQMCSCSFGDRFYFSITSKFRDESIQKWMLDFLEKEGLEVTVE